MQIFAARLSGMFPLVMWIDNEKTKNPTSVFIPPVKMKRMNFRAENGKFFDSIIFDLLGLVGY